MDKENRYGVSVTNEMISEEIDHNGKIKTFFFL